MAAHGWPSCQLPVPSSKTLCAVGPGSGQSALAWLPAGWYRRLESAVSAGARGELITPRTVSMHALSSELSLQAAAPERQQPGHPNGVPIKRCFAVRCMSRAKRLGHSTMQALYEQITTNPQAGLIPLSRLLARSAGADPTSNASSPPGGRWSFSPALLRQLSAGCDLAGAHAPRNPRNEALVSAVGRCGAACLRHRWSGMSALWTTKRSTR